MKTANPTKTAEVHTVTIVEKNLRTRNCRRVFIKNLLPEKRKENMLTKQPRFKSRLNNKTHNNKNKRHFLTYI